MNPHRAVRDLVYLMARIVVTDAGCWEWQGCKNRDGYGRVGTGQKERLIHRLSWTLHRGPIPESMFVLHVCDIPSCVNPDHLFLGTQAANMADMVTKGRQRGPIGEKNHSAKLSAEQALEIRTRTDKGCVWLAREYGVTKQNICSIRSGASWKCLGAP